MPNPSHSSSLKTPPVWLCELPKKDPWSRPFAESLLTHLDLFEGATILDVACGDGIPAFYLAHHVGPEGQVVGIDVNHAQLIRARAVQGPYFPWLEFRLGDARTLPSDLGQFHRITGQSVFYVFSASPFRSPSAIGSVSQAWRAIGSHIPLPWNV